MRTVLLFALGFVFYALVKGLFFREKFKEVRQRAGARKAPARDAGEEAVFDPVCGSYVPIGSSIKVGTGGEVAYFCSERCKEKFLRGKKE